MEERYERLRDQSLRQLSIKSELGLFVSRGMAAWMKAWGSYVPAGKKLDKNNTARRQSSMKIQDDIVMILAGMALCFTERGKDDCSNALQG